MNTEHQPDGTEQPGLMGCLSEGLLRRHAIEINAAHSKLRELDSAVARLVVLFDQANGRLHQVEGQSARNAATLEQILGRIDAFSLKYDTLSAQIAALEESVRAANSSILDRLKAEREEATESHVARLREVEAITVKLTKIAGLVATLVLMVSVVWRIAFGAGFASLLGGH